MHKALVFLFFLLMLVSMPTLAAEHTIMLTPEQETALLYATEQVNERRSGGMDTQGNSLAVFTPDEVLAKNITKYLAEQQRVMDARLAESLPILQALDAATSAKVLQMSPASPAIKKRLQEKLGIK